MTLPASFATFFGKYLLEHGIVDEDVLEDALIEQGRESTLLGDLAVVRGYMRKEDVTQVFEAQKVSDKQFGELAVEFGVLLPDQLEDLLFVQNVHTTHLGELLLSRGAITETQFEAALEAFSLEEKQGRETAEQVFQHHPHKHVLRAFTQAIEAAFSRFMKERVKVRAICEECTPGVFDVEFRFGLGFASQPGKVCMVFLGTEFARKIAERLSGEPLGECQDECLAQCRGFMEVVERYLVANLERTGTAPLSHSLDATFTRKAHFDKADTLSVEMISPDGPMKLAVVVQER